MKYSFMLFALLCAVSITLYAQPGTLDKSFGEGGISISATYGGCNDLLIQQDGKILSVGSGFFNGRGGYLVVRYNGDGTPDLSFGDSSRALAHISPIEAGGLYGTLQEDGKIVVAGYVAQPAGNHLAVVRYTANGDLDSSFGASGVVFDTIRTDAETPTGIVVQPDGKIVVGGYTEVYSEGAGFPTIYLVRYNEDGSHDLSFGNKGIYQEEIQAVFTGGGLALQPDGKLLIGGSTDYTGTPFLVKRYTKEGVPDKEFGTNGEAKYYFTNPVSRGSVLYNLTLQPDGKIIAAGSTYYGIYGEAPRATLVRFNPDGSVDNSFGEKGAVTTNIGKYDSRIYDVAIQPDGRIAAAVNSIEYITGKEEFAVARYLADGTLDSSFGVNGSQVNSINDKSATYAVALQKDGKIVAGGYSVTYNPIYYHVTLARFNGDKDKQPLAIRIKRWLQHHGISWQGVQGSSNNIRYYTIQRSADGIVYKDIAKVSKQVTTYEDAATLNSTGSYYRIAATGWDGLRTYSNTILIDEAQSTRIFPNPVRDNLQLQGLPQTGKTSVSVMDLNGTVRSSATATGTNYSVNTANLGSGSYLLKIQHNGMATMLPFVKE